MRPAVKIWAEGAAQTPDDDHNAWVRSTRLDVWLGRAKMWALLIREGANQPSHPAHQSSFVPLQQWLIDHQPEAIGLLLKKEKRDD